MVELIPPLRSDKVLIVGKGPGWDKARSFFPTDWNIWTIPQSYGLLESHRVDLVFEIHDPDAWRRKKVRIQMINNTFSPPKLIVANRVSGFTDNSYLLPVEQINQLDLPLINSFAWMIAYALCRDIKTIAFRGINLNWMKEAEAERDGIMFLLGYLKAIGIHLDIDPTSGISRGHSIQL